MDSEVTFISLFCLATAIALLVRRVPVPYTVALVVAGLVAGAVNLVAPPLLTKTLLFTIFLPGLIFEAAFHLELAAVRDNIRTITGLAVPGVVVAIGLTAWLTTSLLQGLGIDPTFSWSTGLVFGALIAATDPIAVVALFRTLHVPDRLSVLVEGESLLNDGTAIVLFTLVLAVVGGNAPTISALALSFLTATVGGALLGSVVGWLASVVTKRVDEPMIEISLTVIAAYGSFIGAEHFHASGVIATVAAGLVFGTYGREHGMSAATQSAVISFWAYVAFAMNSVVFLLIGFDTSLSVLASYWREIAVAFGTVLLARLMVVYLAAALLRGSRERLPRHWPMIISWGGIRGALSVVLALGLPESLPNREKIIAMTIGVVILSILTQGVTMAPLLRLTGIARTPSRSVDE